MAKFYGTVGFIRYGEAPDQPGVWKDITTERKYKGDILKDVRQWESSEYLNNNLNISNTISIVADNYAYENYSYIRYIELGGSFWLVTNIEIQRPRLILRIGNLYNGKKNRTS